ncbi:MAG: hypothetical protein GXY91_01110 [Clostridia bacterium]|nr:hypothetical protein [Clostridia bacterium]
MKIIVKAPGTCGELVQGMLNDINVHITCPINLYSQVGIQLNNSQNLTITDPKKTKVLQAVTKTMLHLTGKIWGAHIEINSQILEAKGMASSTADISAAIFATGKVLGYTLSSSEIAKIALSIEPSDGLFFPGIVAFDHVRGKFYKKIGKAPNLDILVFDYGGEVDTIKFNQRPDLQEKNRNNELTIKKAFRLVEEGIKTQNNSLIAQGSTISALTNQNIILKPGLEKILELALKEGALGINIAHSGTLLGIFIEPDKVEESELHKKITKEFSFIKFIGKYKLINGGINELREVGEPCSIFENMVAT